MRHFILTAALAALTATAIPVSASPPPWAPAHGKRAHDHAQHHDRHDAKYDRYGRYQEPRRLSRNDRIWRARDGRYHCRRDNGTTGLIIGAAVGGLIGHELDGGRDHLVGTIIGAAGGALLGRSIDRGELRCR